MKSLWLFGDVLNYNTAKIETKRETTKLLTFVNIDLADSRKFSNFAA